MPCLKMTNLGPERIPEVCRRVSELVGREGGIAYIVGGWIRDALMGGEEVSPDMDVEVFGIEPEKLVRLLTENFRCDLYGKSFQIIGLRDHGVDVAIPRRERKVGSGHADFLVEGDPFMTIEEAAARRDFTVNAVYGRLNDGQLVDPYGGVEDLKKGILRHTTERFVEDPLRVLRGMQFAARFGFQVSDETIQLSQTLTQQALSPERLFVEWKKLILKGKDYFAGLEYLRKCRWLEFYPELEALVGCEQDPKWHPEGDVWIHTLHCLNAFAQTRIGDEWEDLVVGFAVLCHDFGKAVTTEHRDGRIRSPGHAKAGVEISRSFLGRMTNQKDLIDEILPLVQDHMTPYELYKKAGNAAIRRLAGRVGRIDRLIRVATADKGGRPPKPWIQPIPEGEWLMKKAGELSVQDQAPKPMMQGRHLIELGHQPGPEMGRILKDAFEAQLDGEFGDLDGGIEWLKERIK
jgi:tRNA nucleotidyltransferase (CCA-adding enzyme)